jgi:hypothetical protein
MSGLETPSRLPSCILAGAGWNRIAVKRLSIRFRPPTRRNVSTGIAVMKTITMLFAVAALSLAATAAEAKGCLKGAVVGGVAGHYAGHHGVLGAIAGCAYGRHRANEQARQGDQSQPQPPAAGQEKL